MTRHSGSKRSSKQTTTKPKKSALRTTYTVIVTLIILGGCGVGAYYLYKYLLEKHNKINNIESFTDNVDSDASEYYNPDKEVLVVFCKMESCGHCRQFNDKAWTQVEPELNNTVLKSGKTLKMMVADMEHPLSSDVTGFPTIKTFTTDPKSYTEYNGNRTQEDFKDYCLNL